MELEGSMVGASNSPHPPPPQWPKLDPGLVISLPGPIPDFTAQTECWNLWKRRWQWAESPLTSFEKRNLLGPSSGNSDISTAINELRQLPTLPCILDGRSLPLCCIQPLASPPFPSWPPQASHSQYCGQASFGVIDTWSHLSTLVPLYCIVTRGAEILCPALRWGWDLRIEAIPPHVPYVPYVPYGSLDFHSAHCLLMKHCASLLRQSRLTGF